MMRKVNPFKPTAGAEPPVLVGRDEVLADFEDGLFGGVGAPGRLMRITGPRGSGKTVLLTELGDIARRQGWTVVDETAQPQLIERLRTRLSKDGVDRVTVGFDAVVVKAELAATREPETDLRSALDAVASKLTKQGTGLLVTLDEAQNASLADISEIAIAVQHLIREKKNIAFVFAGITSGVMSLLSEEGPTFLRRAKAEELETIPLDEVALALKHSLTLGGFSIGQEALDAAAVATAGYAYLIQLVGYYVWRVAVRHEQVSSEVTVADVDEGVSRAAKEFERAVLETALAGLSRSAMDYLLAMSQLGDVSSTGEVASRMDQAASSLSSTRQTLIDRQIIEPTARGYVGFSVPFMRQYLLSNRSALLARYGEAE